MFKKFKTNKAILTIVIERKENDNDEIDIPRKYFSPKNNNNNNLEICLGTGIWLWF